MGIKLEKWSIFECSQNNKKQFIVNRVMFDVLVQGRSY